MKNLTSILTILLLTVKSLVANPVTLTYTSMEKTGERCQIYVGKEYAQVSCAVDYTINEPNSHIVEFRVPVYWPSARKANADTILKTIGMRFETKRQTYPPLGMTLHFTDGTSSYISVTGALPPINPNNLSIATVDLHFRMRPPKNKHFSIVVSYTQPLINGTCHYLPLFEEGNIPMKDKNLLITFFPSKGENLTLLTKHPDRVKDEFKTRITIIPRHQEIISVKTSPN